MMNSEESVIKTENSDRKFSGSKLPLLFHMSADI